MRPEENAMKAVAKGERLFNDATFDSLARLRMGEPALPEGERTDADNDVIN